ncbi:hypothetical protein [Solirhodobacter olei]|jgi:hypothetical protein|uniref:hypothetical protein n=1 Tax=Solirhodobacter olei TaxID=2493082 RepID=UPI000FD8AB15|nr:hypothetical protein [Solirhodobacter olei]
MPRLLHLLTLLALTLPALPAPAADKPMSAAEFDSYSLGKTLYYAIGGKPYGAETYLPDHKVVWAFLGQPCKRGSWYEAGGLLCFVYPGDDRGPQCWSFFRAGAGLKAHFAGDPDGTDLIEVRQSDKPLICPGPKAGV